MLGMESATTPLNNYAGLRLDGAVRTSKRKREARSPKQQRDMMRACADANGYKVQRIHDSGRSESGKTMDRETLHEVMRRVKAGETDGLILALTDRLGRAPIEEAMAYVRELGNVGYLVLADAGGRPVDLSDPMAETNLVLQLQMARQYWLATAKRFRMSQTDAVKAGKHVGPTPLGYRRKAGRLYVDPKFGPIVTEAYKIAAAQGIHAAVDYLKANVPARSWNTDHARRFLATRTYLGESRTGDLVNLEAHEALTDIDTWTAAQTAPRKRRSNGEYPLSHIAECGKCGHGLVGALQTVGERKYRRMRCSNPACKGGTSVSADALEMHVRDELKAAFGNAEYRAQFSPNGLAEAAEKLDSASAEVVRYVEDTEIRKLIGDARWRAGMAARVDAENAAREIHRVLAEAAGQYATLPLAHELDDPAKFAAALRAVITVDRIIVRPGRGVIGERVTFDKRNVVAGSVAA